ncbi:unnamed protein product [Caenorhabditis auriculariae]|uniref:Uncharacterized protein n=1 Tax=Caenorhabditis auriculariae TaxID=2777116 RepID=A0A8S1HWY0_9PELO|nr:unnamed protein product [Caenorhabditis auriculariae]
MMHAFMIIFPISVPTRCVTAERVLLTPPTTAFCRLLSTRRTFRASKIMGQSQSYELNHDKHDRQEETPVRGLRRTSRSDDSVFPVTHPRAQEDGFDYREDDLRERIRKSELRERNDEYAQRLRGNSQVPAYPLPTAPEEPTKSPTKSTRVPKMRLESQQNDSIKVHIEKRTPELDDQLGVSNFLPPYKSEKEKKRPAPHYDDVASESFLPEETTSFVGVTEHKPPRWTKRSSWKAVSLEALHRSPETCEQGKQNDSMVLTRTEKSLLDSLPIIEKGGSSPTRSHHPHFDYCPQQPTRKCVSTQSCEELERTREVHELPLTPDRIQKEEEEEGTTRLDQVFYTEHHRAIVAVEGGNKEPRKILSQQQRATQIVSINVNCNDDENRPEFPQTPAQDDPKKMTKSLKTPTGFLLDSPQEEKLFYIPHMETIILEHRPRFSSYEKLAA